MPRPKKIDRPTRLETRIPESVHAKVALELYSEIESGVPFGAWSELITNLLIDWLKERGIAV